MKTKLAILLFGLIAAVQSACTHSAGAVRKQSIEDAHQSMQTSTALYKQLEVIYRAKIAENDEDFFRNWNATVKQNSDDFIGQDNIIKAVFDIYKEIYQPTDLLKLGNWEWGNELNEGCKFFVVQNEIRYVVVNESDLENEGYLDDNPSGVNLIKNFRPSVNIAAGKVLYLTPEYNDALTKFLGTESTQLGEVDLMSPSAATGESKRRYKFLRTYIPILHGHGEGYWHLETHPQVESLLINKTLTRATVYFRVGYQGGTAMLERTSGGWKIIQSKTTWIE